MLENKVWSSDAFKYILFTKQLKENISFKQYVYKKGSRGILPWKIRINLKMMLAENIKIYCLVVISKTGTMPIVFLALLLPHCLVLYIDTEFEIVPNNDLYKI